MYYFDIVFQIGLRKIGFRLRASSAEEIQMIAVSSVFHTHPGMCVLTDKDLVQQVLLPPSVAPLLIKRD